MRPAGKTNKWIVLSTVGVGLFMAALDTSIVSIAIPAIMTDLGSSVETVSWVLNAYTLGLVALYLSMSRVADRFGRKPVFITGLALFTVFSLACALAPSVGWLIAFRVAQAAGAASITPVSLLILFDVFPKKQHGLVTGIWGGIGAAGAALAPTLGGVLTDYASWSWIFLVNVPFGLAAIAFAVRFIHGRKADGASIDFAGVMLSGAAFFSLALAFIQSNAWGWSSPQIISLFGLAALLLGLFVLWQLKSRSPLLDLRLFRSRSFSAANAAIAIIGLAMMGALFFLVIFIVRIMDYSELKAAVTITPLPASVIVLSPLVGRLVDRVSFRLPSLVGVVLLTSGLFTLTQLGTGSSWLDIAWRSALLGAGMAFCLPALFSAGMESVPERFGSIGSAAVNWSYQIGFVLGVAILVAAFSHSLQVNLESASSRIDDVVASEPSIPDSQRAGISHNIDGYIAAMQNGGSSDTGDQPMQASAQGDPQQGMFTEIRGILQTSASDSFQLPFCIAATIAITALVPVSFLNKKVV